MILFKKYLLLFMALTIVMSASARSEQLARPMSLQDCIDFAMKNSDTLKNARLNVRRQQAQNNQIQALALPHVNGNGQLQYFPYQQQTLIPAAIFGKDSATGKLPDGFVALPFTPRWSSTVSLSGSQTLFDGTLLVALKTRKTIMEVARQAAQLTEEGLKYQIQRGYYAVVIGQVQFNNIADALRNARDASHDVEVLYNTGFAEKIDVDRSHVQTSNLETDSIRLAGMIETGQQALKFVIGMDIQEPIVLTDTSLDDNLREAAELLTEQLEYSKRTEYTLLNTSLQLDKAMLKRYQLAAWPTLNFFANSGYNYGANDFSDLTKLRKNYLFSTLIGLQLSVPIFNGLLRQNQVREAKINVEKTENNLHQLRLALDFQTAQSQVTLKNALLAAESQKRNLDLANTVVDLARRKYKAGVGSNSEVTLAQTELLQSQNNFYTSMLDVINAQADVQKALGDFGSK